MHPVASQNVEATRALQSPGHQRLTFGPYVLERALKVFGPTLDQSAAGCASGALDWLEQQFSRPVERAEQDGWGRTKRVWRLADDGELLGAGRGIWRARRRRAADRVVRLR